MPILVWNVNNIPCNINVKRPYGAANRPQISWHRENNLTNYILLAGWTWKFASLLVSGRRRHLRRIQLIYLAGNKRSATTIRAAVLNFEIQFAEFCIVAESCSKLPVGVAVNLCEGKHSLHKYAKTAGLKQYIGNLISVLSVLQLSFNFCISGDRRLRKVLYINKCVIN